MRDSQTCGFCWRELSQEEQTTRSNAVGLCHECFHLRRMIRRRGWHKWRARVTSDAATERRIESWFSGWGDQRRR